MFLYLANCVQYWHITFMLLRLTFLCYYISNTDETPLFNACLNENQNIVKILLDHSANIFIKDTEGITALDLVVAVDNKEILDCLISACVKDPITFLAESDIGTQGRVNKYIILHSEFHVYYYCKSSIFILSTSCINTSLSFILLLYFLFLNFF